MEEGHPRGVTYRHDYVRDSLCAALNHVPDVIAYKEPTVKQRHPRDQRRADNKPLQALPATQKKIQRCNNAATRTIELVHTYFFSGFEPEFRDWQPGVLA